MSRRTTADLLSAYNTHPWLRQVVNRISYSVASVPWEVQRATTARAKRMMAMPRALPAQAAKIKTELRKSGELVPIEAHPMLDLIDGGSPALGGVALRQITTMQIDLAGESFWMPDWDGAGRPSAISLLSPAWVREVPRWSDVNGVYKVRLPGTAVEVDFPAALITWLRDPSPLDPYGRGAGFAGSLDDEIDADQSASKHIRGFFENNAIPPLIAFVEGLEPSQVAAFEEKWLSKTQGASKFRRPLFTGTKFEIKELSAKFSDMEIVELRRFFGDVFQEVYGVPPEILGKVRDSNRATIDAAEMIFATFCLVPRLDRLRFAYQSLADRFGDGLVVDYESPIPEDWDYKLKVYQAAPFAFTVDEWRDMASEEPLLDAEQGAMRFTPVNTQPVGSVPAADDVIPDAAADDSKQIAAVIPIDSHRIAATVVGSLHAGSMRAAAKSAALTRRINARTRVELRHAVIAGIETGDAEHRVAAVFTHAIEARATGIARTEGDAAMKRALRAAFAEQRDAALAALVTATATPTAPAASAG